MSNTLGLVKGRANAKREVCILAPATVANNGAPTTALQGIPVYPTAALDGDTGHCYPGQPANHSTLLIKGECNTGQTLVGTFTLWGYNISTAAWYPVFVPGALSETAADVIRYAGAIANLGHWDRLYLQLASVGGTGATFEAWLITAQEAF